MKVKWGEGLIALVTMLLIQARLPRWVWIDTCWGRYQLRRWITGLCRIVIGSQEDRVSAATGRPRELAYRN